MPCSPASPTGWRRRGSRSTRTRKRRCSSCSRAATWCLDSHRLGQVAGGHLPSLHGPLPRARSPSTPAPIKALVNEKFFDLCDAFGARNVGMVTGDAAINREAPVAAAPRRCWRTWRCARPTARGLGGDGRVPLLRRPRARRRLAGAASSPGEDAVPAHVRHAGRHARHRGEPEGGHRREVARSPPCSGRCRWT